SGVAACGGGTTTTNAGPVAVGSVLDGTGGLNIYGTVMIDATNFAIDEINKKGGVLGRQLKLTAFDAQSTNDKYVQYADQLMLDTKAAVIMGGITSGSREAMRPSIDKNKQLYFYNEQYEGGVCDKYVFCTGVVPSQQLSTLVKWTMDNVGKTVYTLAADYNYGHISSDWVKFYLSKNGGTLLGVDFIPLDVADFGSILTKLQQKKPAAVMSLLVGGAHISFYRQFAAAGLQSKMKIVSPTFGLGNEQVVLAPNESAGITVAYPYFQELSSPTNQKWVADWKTRFGANYPYVTDSANAVWTGWHFWAEAVNKAGAADSFARPRLIRDSHGPGPDHRYLGPDERGDAAAHLRRPGGDLRVDARHQPRPRRVPDARRLCGAGRHPERDQRLDRHPTRWRLCGYLRPVYLAPFDPLDLQPHPGHASR